LAKAQYNLGVGYEKGEGVPQDPAEAAKWYRLAADQGYARAQYNLGVCYAHGAGVPQDHAEAVKWYRKAAAQNHAMAQANLGLCLYNGQGVAKDEVQAYKWGLLASAQGNEVARKNIPILEGKLTREQRAAGQKLAGDFRPLEVLSLDDQPGEADGQPLAELRAKAATGDAKAQNELGEAFYAGKRGVTKDAVQAVKWFRLAADQNFAAAQSNLGVCYERGDGVAKYEVEAYKWDLLAAVQGDSKAKHNAAMLELLLSQEQIAEGKRRAQDWLEQRKKASAGER
jgi:TPR repeat protein